MTTVINLFGGPGIGKSTTAAGLFYEMKLLGYDVELVREYAKTFAYHNTMPEQTYLYAKQLKAESSLYEKVDYIITDSTLWLSAFYEEKYLSCANLSPLIKSVVGKRPEKNFLLSRHKPYHQNGRLQSAEEAKSIDLALMNFLNRQNVSFSSVAVADRERVSFILKEL